MKKYGHGLVKKEERESRYRNLKETGIPGNRIFLDVRVKNAYTKSECPAFDSLLEEINSDDTVYVKGFDELGFDYRDIADKWEHIFYDRQANIVMLDMPNIDTRRHRDVVGAVVAHMLHYLGDMETKRKRQQHQGIKYARQQGVKFGRPKVDLPENFETCCRMHLNGEVSQMEGAKMCGMARSTFVRRVALYVQQNGG